MQTTFVEIGALRVNLNVQFQTGTKSVLTFYKGTNKRQYNTNRSNMTRNGKLLKKNLNQQSQE